MWSHGDLIFPTVVQAWWIWLKEQWGQRIIFHQTDPYILLENQLELALHSVLLPETLILIWCLFWLTQVGSLPCKNHHVEETYRFSVSFSYFFLPNVFFAATSFSRSPLQPLIPLMQIMPDQFHLTVPYIVSLMTGLPASFCWVLALLVASWILLNGVGKNKPEQSKTFFLLWLSFLNNQV